MLVVTSDSVSGSNSPYRFIVSTIASSIIVAITKNRDTKRWIDNEFKLPSEWTPDWNVKLGITIHLRFVIYLINLKIYVLS